MENLTHIVKTQECWMFEEEASTLFICPIKSEKSFFCFCLFYLCPFASLSTKKHLKCFQRSSRGWDRFAQCQHPVILHVDLYWKNRERKKGKFRIWFFLFCFFCTHDIFLCPIVFIFTFALFCFQILDVNCVVGPLRFVSVCVIECVFSGVILALF